MMMMGSEKKMFSESFDSKDIYLRALKNLACYANEDFEKKSNVF